MIKLKKLRRIVSKLVSSDVNILVVSSDNIRGINAATNTREIFINGDKLKSDEEIIKGVAHEVTHILHPDLSCSTNQFIADWYDIEKEIIKLYKE